jgi:hypothetical protein
MRLIAETDLADGADCCQQIWGSGLSGCLANASFCWPQPLGNKQPLSIRLMLLDILRRQDTAESQTVLTKIDEQSQGTAGNRQVTNHLGQVTVLQATQGLDLHHYLLIDNKIWNVVTN